MSQECQARRVSSEMRERVAISQTEWRASYARCEAGPRGARQGLGVTLLILLSALAFSLPKVMKCMAVYLLGQYISSSYCVPRGLLPPLVPASL